MASGSAAADGEGTVTSVKTPLGLMVCAWACVANAANAPTARATLRTALIFAPSLITGGNAALLSHRFPRDLPFAAADRSGAWERRGLSGLQGRGIGRALRFHSLPF